MAPEEFWQLLTSVAKPKLRDVFGNDLQQQGRRSYGVEIGQGAVSLGCYRVTSPPQLCVQRLRPESRGRIRIEFHAGDYEFDLGVTDIRLYRDDHFTPDDDIVRRTNERLKDTANLILSVGLTRPFESSDQREPRHWLQVNNIHFADDPCWQLG
jgi:hypothetical protein